MKLSSLKLAKEYMKRITRELESNEALQEDSLLLQGVRFAFRVHQVSTLFLFQKVDISFYLTHQLNHQDIQFAGGFDAETIQEFQELKKIGRLNTKIQQPDQISNTF